jgi:hypothetical protein
MDKNWVAWPTCKVFSAHEAQKFYTHVRAINQATYNAVIAEPRDIMLRSDGRLQVDGSRLSLLAIKQLCQQLAAGLWTYASDVSGLIRRPGRADVLLKPALAVETINKAIDLRFLLEDGIRRRQLIKNTAIHVVDGIVGAGYRYLPHAQLYELVEDFIVAAGTPIKFDSAALHGRRLAMLFLHKSPLFTFMDREFCQGHYFSNSEVGECSVSVASALTCGTLRCLGPFNRLPHAGRNFAKRLNKKLTSATARLPFRGVQTADAIAATLRRSLDLVSNASVDQKRRQNLVHTLTIVGKLSYELAMQVVDQSVYGDAQPVSATPTKQPTYFDLFIRLMHVAKTLHIAARETMERTAYKLLTGKLVL